MIKDIIDANKNINATQMKLEKLKELFPGAFHGETVDLEYISKQLKEVKFTKEGYELNFLGKSYAKLLAALDTETVILPDEAHNKENINQHSKNLYLTADNLDGLKHLVKSYWKKFKVIYIDPPYNTGSDGFAYNDTFGFTKNVLLEKLGISEEEAERVLDMTTSGSSSHSAWLTFMYPRLYLAKQLLTDDGVVFISIGENEVFNLKLLCDDIFGESNFISNVTRIAKRTSNKGTYFKPTKDYILVYAKNTEFIQPFFLKKDIKYSDYKFSDDLGRYRLSGASLYQPSLDPLRGCINQRYYIEAPDGSLLIPPGEVFPEEKKMDP